MSSSDLGPAWPNFPLLFGAVAITAVAIYLHGRYLELRRDSGPWVPPAWRLPCVEDLHTEYPEQLRPFDWSLDVPELTDA